MALSLSPDSNGFINYPHQFTCDPTDEIEYMRALHVEYQGRQERTPVMFSLFRATRRVCRIIVRPHDDAEERAKAVNEIMVACVVFGITEVMIGMDSWVSAYGEAEKFEGFVFSQISHDLGEIRCYPYKRDGNVVTWSGAGHLKSDDLDFASLNINATLEVVQTFCLDIPPPLVADLAEFTLEVLTRRGHTVTAVKDLAEVVF